MAGLDACHAVEKAYLNNQLLAHELFIVSQYVRFLPCAICAACLRFCNCLPAASLMMFCSKSSIPTKRTKGWKIFQTESENFVTASARGSSYGRLAAYVLREVNILLVLVNNSAAENWGKTKNMFHEKHRHQGWKSSDSSISSIQSFSQLNLIIFI